LNLRFLELLSAAASGLREGLFTPIALDLRREWQALSASRLLLLAECPYLLLDAAFAVPERWRSMMAGAVHDAPPSSISDSIGTELVRRTLVLAWHLARANPLAARITLGMSAECMVLIAGTGLHELEALAETRPVWVRPRWENRPEIWRQLLHAAGDNQQTRLRQLQLRGLQLLAGAMVDRGQR
jgi:hypothetical protein